MLKIPVPGDRPAPLVIPVKAMEVDVTGGTSAEHHENVRRRKKSHHGEKHAWDSSNKKSRRSGRSEKRQMFWMLVGGSTLFALIVAGVLTAMLGGDKPQVQTPQDQAAKTNPADPGAKPAAQLGDAAFLTDAEPLARRFLEAGNVGEMLPLVREPKLIEERMTRFYKNGKIKPAGVSAFNIDSQVSRSGAVFSVRVRTKEFEERALAFFQTADGLKIDWASWVGWSEMTWGEFVASKPTTPKLFRVHLSPIEYYNMAFSDDKKWQSYQLESADGANSVYGYAERGSVLNARLRPPPDSRKIALTLMLKFPEKATSKNQVFIDKWIAEGWVMENEATP